MILSQERENYKVISPSFDLRCFTSDSEEKTHFSPDGIYIIWLGEDPDTNICIQLGSAIAGENLRAANEPVIEKL